MSDKPKPRTARVEIELAPYEHLLAWLDKRGSIKRVDGDTPQRAKKQHVADLVTAFLASWSALTEVDMLKARAAAEEEKLDRMQEEALAQAAEQKERVAKHRKALDDLLAKNAPASVRADLATPLNPHGQG